MKEKVISREKLIQEAIEQFHLLGKRMGPGREQLLCKSQLNHAQLKFLYFVCTETELTIPKLVAMTNTTPGAVTQIVDGLIKEGFLQRNHDEKDKRRVYISLSVEGKKRFARIRKLHIRYLKSLFGVLSDAELQSLVTIEQKLIHKLSLD